MLFRTIASVAVEHAEDAVLIRDRFVDEQRLKWDGPEAVLVDVASATARAEHPAEQEISPVPARFDDVDEERAGDSAADVPVVLLVASQDGACAGVDRVEIDRVWED